MKQWFADGHPHHGHELLHRAQELGINTCRVGSPHIEEIRHLDSDRRTG
ncbi:MAG: hypothetical protein ABSG68_08240 [Thermoguttaceae bacterium]|jgi:hypothetical protein